MTDLRRQLIDPKKRTDTFQRSYQQCQAMVQTIKQTNDRLQRNAGTDQEQAIAEQIQKQQDFMENEIMEIKKKLEDLQSKFKEPQARKKIKNLRGEAQKQIQRNRIILRQFINKSYNNVEKQKKSVRIGKNQKKTWQKQYAKQNKQSYHQVNSSSFSEGKNSKQKQNNQRQQQIQADIEIDYQIQNKILQQRTHALGQVEQKMYKLNEMIMETGQMIYQQGDNLDFITEETQRANKNVLQANTEIQEASELQKKARRKTMCLVIVIIIGVVLVGGIFLLIFKK